MKRIVITQFLLLFLVSGLIYISEPHFWNRYTGLIKAQIFKQNRGQWYSPLADVDSLKGDRLETYSDESFEQRTNFRQALDSAEAYVDGRNSSSFLVWHDGEIVRESYFGETNEDSLIVSKSMAKQLSAMVVARALEQGYFESLDQKASDFFQEWRGTDKDQITLRQILNMTIGYERFYRITKNPFANFHRGFLSGKHEDIIINDIPLQEPPGTYYDYSQITSDLTAVLIERATGKQYQDYLAEQLLQPIDAAGGTIWVNREGGVAHSGCCIMLPADTWLRLGVLMAQDGAWNGERILPEWWVDEVLKGSSTNPNYGLSFWLGTPHQPRRYIVDPKQVDNPGMFQSQPYATDDVIMFDGNGSQVIYIVPSKKLVAVRTGEWPGTDDEGNEWDNTYVPNLLIEALDADTSLSVKEANTPPLHSRRQCKLTARWGR